jgi:hypothetical protein
MSRVPAALAALAVMMSVALALALSAPALAHERRMVGPYQLVVGWLAEPAFQGQANAASVRITDTRVTPAKAVEGLQETVRIEISSGGLAPYRGTVRAVFGQPGLYALDIIPTAAGSYSFHISGKVETLDVNEVFESGPGRFDDVRAQTELQYPTKAPVADELAERLAAIERDLGAARALALAALTLAIAIPLGALWRARSRR